MITDSREIAMKPIQNRRSSSPDLRTQRSRRPPINAVAPSRTNGAESGRCGGVRAELRRDW
ncbi:hypothetical protein Hanom_Chr04g00377831 [Helianthus anomalus]